MSALAGRARESSALLKILAVEGQSLPLPPSTPVFAVSLHHAVHGLAEAFSGD